MTVPMLMGMMAGGAVDAGGGGVDAYRLEVLTQQFSSGTTFAVDLPSSVPAGAGILVILQLGTSTLTPITVPGSPWIQLTGEGPTYQPSSVAALYKIADGTEGGTQVTFTTSTAREAKAQVHVYRATVADVDKPPIWHQYDQASTTASPRSPELQAGWGAEPVQYMSVLGMRAGRPVSGVPSGYGGQTVQDTAGSSSSEPTLATVVRAFASQAVEHPPAWSISGTSTSAMRQHTLAFAGGGATPINAPVVRAISTQNNNGSTSTTHPVDLPALNDGDRCMVFFVCFGNNVITSPGALTDAYSFTQGTIRRHRIAYRDAVGAEGATTVDFTTSGATYSAALVLVFEAGTFDAAETVAVAQASLGTVERSAPALTPGWGTADQLVVHWTVGNTAQDPLIWTPNLDRRAVNNNQGTSGVSSAWSWRPIRGAINAVVYRWGGNASTSIFTCAIKGA